MLFSSAASQFFFICFAFVIFYRLQKCPFEHIYFHAKAHADTDDMYTHRALQSKPGEQMSSVSDQLQRNAGKSCGTAVRGDKKCAGQRRRERVTYREG